ncbi:hypothetical protein [Ideonella margarita]|uniref:DUF2550 family protein n=1 Tax=Ideonella margarita TaxID=2984191 RepID=A0ABU9C797_9BURK
MPPSDLPFYLQPQWFLPGLVLLWLVTSVVIAWLAGWRALAALYPALADGAGPWLRFVTGTLGSPHWPMRYKRCLRLRVDEAGLTVGVMIPFSFGSRPFRVAWTEVAAVAESQSIKNRMVSLQFKGASPVLTLGDDIGQHVLAAWRAAVPAGDAAQPFD